MSGPSIKVPVVNEGLQEGKEVANTHLTDSSSYQ